LYSLVVEALLRQVSIVLDAGDAQGAMRILRQAEEVSDRTVDARLRARVAVRLGELQLASGDYHPAVTNFQTALEFAREDEDLALESRSLRGLAEAQRHVGTPEIARDLLEQLIALEDRIGNTEVVGRAHLDLAELALDSRKFDDALRSLAKAREAANLVYDPEMQI